MLKNIKIGTKLVIVGTLLIVLPLLVVAVIAISKSSQDLGKVENENLMGRAFDIAQIVDKAFEEEKKLSICLSLDPEIMTAARAAYEKSTVAPMVKNAAESAAQSAAHVNAKLARLMQAKGLGDNYQVLFCFGADGICFAASDPAYVNRDFSDRGYVKNALAGTTNVGDAALNKLTKKPFMPFASPIRVGDKVVGGFAAIADISFLNKLIQDIKVGTTGYAFITDASGLFIAHPKAENIFVLNSSTLKGMEEVSKRMLAGELGVSSYVFQGVAKTAGYAPVKVTRWSVAVTLPNSEYLAAADEVRNLILIVSALGLLAAVLVFMFFSRTITKPLAKGVSFAETVAAGDFTHQLPIKQKDEVGKLADALNAMSRKLTDIVGTIRNRAQQVTASSEEISASAQKLAEGSQSQASTLEETSASVEELTASVEQVAEHAQSQAAAVEQGTASMTQVQKSIEQVSASLTEISGLANASVENAMNGARSVQQVVNGINLISQGSEKIGGIVTVISEIADQTNLLALNASIEAARAGEHGRGFAVVADEVSKLADRSAASTKEIESLIKESVRNVSEGVKTATGSHIAMEQIRAASQKVKDMIEALSESMSQQVAAIHQLASALTNVSDMSQSISAATEEQTTNARQVSKAVENVNDLTQSAASAAEEMSAATEELSTMAQELQRLMGQFKIRGAEGAPELAAPAGPS